MIRVGPRLENEPDFREWTPEERASWLREQFEKGRIVVAPPENLRELLEKSKT